MSERSSRSKKKVGVVGFGKMGMLHGALVHKLPTMELAAIADTSSFVRRAFRSLLPAVASFKDYQKMLASVDLDAVIIATPQASHAPLAAMAIDKNLHVFIEKPLTNTLAAATGLYEQATGKPIITMVGFCLRYLPTFATARAMLQRQELGRIQRITGAMYISDVLSEQTGWRYDPAKSGGGVVVDFAIHMIDLLYWFFGRPESVIAQTKKLYSTLVEDEAVMTFQYADGKAAEITSSWSRAEHRKSYSKIHIIGELADLIVTDQTLEIQSKSSSLVSHQFTYPQLYQGYYFDIGGPNYSVQMQQFAEAITTGRNPEADLKAGLDVQYLVDRVYQSALTGQSVPLPYDY